MLDFEFLCVEVWFADQNSKTLEIEDKINITLVHYSAQLRYRKKSNSENGRSNFYDLIDNKSADKISKISKHLQQNDSEAITN